jgi:hypothetical protein
MSYGDMTWRVSIAPQVAPNIFGNYIDVSDYVDAQSLGSINVETEQSDFSVGIAKTSSITLKLKNDTGLFSDEGQADTLFTYKRAGSKVKIAYFEGLEVSRYGSAVYGDSVYGDELDIFEGVISSESPRQDVSTDMISLSVLGFDSIFSGVEVGAGDINTTQSIRFIFENLLSKSAILALASVNIANFTVGVDLILDNTDDFEDVDTVKEALDILLRVTNSILVIQDGQIFISDKAPSFDVLHTFYGQASDLGIENIQNITGDTDGLPRLYNLWRWDSDAIAEGQPLPLPVSNQTTINKYGVKKQTVGIKGITDDPTRQLILESFTDEYGEKKQELTLSAPASYQTVRLPMLGKVDIDYPAPQFPADGGDLPIWGTPSMVWDEFVWPYTLFNYTIQQTTKFKIIGIQFNIKSDLVTYTLREI